MTKLRMLSSNVLKLREVQDILRPASIEIVAVQRKIEELQTEDARRLVRDKVLRAFEEIGRPVLVEHTGLYLEQLGGLPGGLTQIVWDRLGADRFSELFGRNLDPNAVARTVIGYCDARRIEFFEGEIKGRITEKPAGSRDFQWDCVFVPDGHTQTFAELGEMKNEISMRRRALDQFVAHWTGRA